MLSNKLMKQRVIPLFFSPKGRISIGLFWKANFVLLLGFQALLFCIEAFGDVFKLYSDFQSITKILVFLVYVYAIFVLTAKRLHDTNQPGWLSVLCVPTILLWLVIGLMLGTAGKNKYGENPIKYEKNRLYVNLETDLPPPPPPLDNLVSKVVLYFIISFVPIILLFDFFAQIYLSKSIQ